jgi:predicted RNase H-like HicB family nuclease
MSLTAFVERIASGRFRATLSQPFSLVAEGDTKEEAISQLTKLAEMKLSQGKLVELPTRPNHPLLKFAGLWKDRPDMDEYLAAIEEYRAEANSRDQS